MQAMLLLCAVLVLPVDKAHQIEVDCIERNTVYHGSADSYFEQYIFWRWYPDGLHVVDWRAADRARLIYSQGQYVLLIKDYVTPVRITSQYFRETATLTDPEQDDRRFLESSDRETVQRIIQDRTFFSSIFREYD